MLEVPKDCLRETRTLRTSDRGKSTRRRHVPSLIEKEFVTSRCHGNKTITKKKKQMTRIQSFLCMIALRSKTVAHTYFPSFDNENGRLCQDPEILLTW